MIESKKMIVPNMKWIALFLLVVQNTALVLMMRYSLTKTSDHYIVTTAVACMECLKVFTCLVIERMSSPSLRDFLAKLKREILQNPFELAMLAVPSVLYTLQNNLLYVALGNLDAATYQVCYQMKILTTALFSVLLLRKSISLTRWASLVILTIGVSLAQLDASGSKRATDKVQNPFMGFLCVFLACITSGFAGVWFEKILKASKSSIWMRNIQLGMSSIFIALLGVIVKDRAVVAEKGFFHGYNGWVIAVIVLQAIGGLVVAAVVKYADNILKGFGSSISIIISCLIEFLFFEFHPSTSFLVGAVLVNYSISIYASEKFFISNK